MPPKDPSLYICPTCRDTCLCQVCRGRGCELCCGTGFCYVCCDTAAVGRANRQEQYRLMREQAIEKKGKRK